MYITSIYIYYFRFVFPDSVCTLRLHLLFSAAGCSALGNLALAVQRFLVIVFNLSRLKIFQLKSIVIWIPCLWLVVLSMFSVWWIPSDVFSVYWPEYCVPFSEALESATNALIIALIYALSILILIMYIIIYVVVYRSTSRVHLNSRRQSNSKQQQKHIKMAVTLFIVYFLFVITYVPYATFLFVRQDMSLSGQKIYLLFTLYIAALISSFNPVLYVFLFKPIKQAFFRVFNIGNKNQVMDITISVTEGN